MLNLLRSLRRAAATRRLQSRIRAAAAIRLNLGAGGTSYPGWLATEIQLLDITRRGDWERLLGGRQVDALLAEHVWEHLDDEQTRLANQFCHEFLRPGGRLRVAVPDGLHPDPVYREHVRPGGTGPGADDHKILYDYRLMCARLEAAGFAVTLLEYWDEHGRFHSIDWDGAGGHVVRSRRFDQRNTGGRLSYTSLIVDAIKIPGHNPD